MVTDDTEECTLIGNIDSKFLLLHEQKNDDGIKSFFTEVWELHVKVDEKAPCTDEYWSHLTKLTDNNEPISDSSRSDPKRSFRQPGATKRKEVSIAMETCGVAVLLLTCM